VGQEAVPEPAPSNESIAELMARLERGLSKRQEQKPAPSAEAAPIEEGAPATPVFPPAADDRLKSAIDNLQRMTSRGL